jgi:hypothetical protein
MASVSKYRIGEALVSIRELARVIDSLTEEEVLAALQLESASQRRESVLNRLIARAIRLNEVNYSRQLKEKFSWQKSN